MEKLKEMSDPFFTDLREHGEQLVITIPKKVTLFMGWKNGMPLRVIAQEVIREEGKKEE